MMKTLLTEMKRVRVSAPSYSDQIALYTIQKMFVNKQNIDFSQRFHIFKDFCDMYEHICEKEDIKKFMNKVNCFRRKLKFLGLKMIDLDKSGVLIQEQLSIIYLKNLVQFLFLIVFFLFFFPVRSILISIAERKRIEAVNNSVVKGK